MHRGVVLTPAAQVSFRALSNGFDAIRHAVAQLSGSPAAPLSVSCPPSFAHRWLLPRLHEFVSEHSDLDIQVTTQLDIVREGRPKSGSMAMHIMEMAELYDVMIILGRHDHSPIPARKLLPLSVTPMCSPDLMERFDITKENPFAGMPILHDGRGPLYREPDFWTIWLEAAGFDPTLALGGQRFTHSFLSLDAAIAGMGMVVSTPVLAQADLDAGRLILPFERQVPIPQAYYMIVRDEESPNVRTLTDWLVASAAASNFVAA